MDLSSKDSMVVKASHGRSDPGQNGVDSDSKNLPNQENSNSMDLKDMQVKDRDKNLSINSLVSPHKPIKARFFTNHSLTTRSESTDGYNKKRSVKTYIQGFVSKFQTDLTRSISNEAVKDFAYDNQGFQKSQNISICGDIEPVEEEEDDERSEEDNKSARARISFMSDGEDYMISSRRNRSISFNAETKQKEKRTKSSDMNLPLVLEENADENYAELKKRVFFHHVDTLQDNDENALFEQNTSVTKRRNEDRFQSSEVFAIQEDPNEDQENKKLDFLSSSVTSSRRSSKQGDKISSPMSRSMKKIVIDELDNSSKKSQSSLRRENLDYEFQNNINKIEEIMEESDSDDEKKVAKTEMTGIIEKDRMKLNQKLRRLYSQEIINESDSQLMENLEIERPHPTHGLSECEVVIEEPQFEEDQVCHEQQKSH